MSWIKLPHGNDDPHDRYTMPDPEALREAYDRLQWMLSWEPRSEIPGDLIADMKRVLRMARGYVVLTTDCGQEQAVGKLRDVHRALRARRGE